MLVVLCMGDVLDLLYKKMLSVCVVGVCFGGVSVVSVCCRCSCCWGVLLVWVVGVGCWCVVLLLVRGVGACCHTS